MRRVPRLLALLASTIAISVVTSTCAPRSRPRILPMLVDPGGCRLEQVTAAAPGEGHFQFHGPSPDGRRMVIGWFRGNDRGAYLLDLVTGTRSELPGIDNAGTFSADGARLLIANRQPGGNREIIEYDPIHRTTGIVAPDSAVDFLPTYSRDGRGILFNSYRTGRSDLYLLDRATGALRRLTMFEGYDAHGDLSPDGRHILFHRQVSGPDYDILLLDVVSGEERVLVTGAGEQAYAAWSPHGELIAFASDSASEAGRLDLYVTDFNRRRTVRLTSAPGYNAYPAWSADGRWLYFNSERAGQRNVFRLRLDASMRCVR